MIWIAIMRKSHGTMSLSLYNTAGMSCEFSLPPFPPPLFFFLYIYLAITFHSFLCFPSASPLYTHFTGHVELYGYHGGYIVVRIDLRGPICPPVRSPCEL